MNIPPLGLPAVLPVSSPELGSVNPGAATTGPIVPPVVFGSASIVDLSTLGQLLSASAMLQPQSRQVTVDAVGEQNPSASIDDSDGFGRLLAAAQTFVGAFNQFQSQDVNSVNNAQDPLLAPFQNALLVAINALPASPASTGTADGQSLFAGLAQVGFSFQSEAPNSAASAPLALDPAALEAAFNANPAGTSALLTQAFQTIGQLAATVAAQNTDLFVTGADVAAPASAFDLLPGAAPASVFDLFPTALPPVPFDGVTALVAALQADVTDPESASGATASAPSNASAVNGSQTAPATSAAALSQAPSVDPAAGSALAANVAASATAAALNAQSAAMSTLPASQLDATGNAVPNLIASVITSAIPAALQGSDLNVADAALQRSLADQALRNALGGYPLAASASAALTADEVAPDYAATPVAAALQAAENRDLAEKVALASSASNNVSASAATWAAQVQAMTQAQMKPETPLQAQLSAQLPPPLPAELPTPPPPLAPLDDGRGPLALDPAIAAAVAAYRLGNGALGVSTNKTTARWSEPDADISAVGSTLPVDLDPQGGSDNARRNEKARNAALALAENRALAATELANRKPSTPEFKRTTDT